MTAFTVGQTVIVEPYSYRRSAGFEAAREQTVTKVGKKWITLATDYGRADRFCLLDDDDDHRMDAENDGPYQLDGGDYGSPGRVWRDEAHRTGYLAKETAWRRLTALARERATMPAHLTTADLERIADQLTPPEQ